MSQPMSISRRSLIGGLAALAAAGPLLVACGSTAEPEGAASSAAAGGGPEEGAFPVTITHKFGETAIEAEPVRIVCVGLKEQDDLLALGIVPVAASKWFPLSADNEVIGPWATDALGESTPPEALETEDGIGYEKIASLAPDLILALYAGLTKADYTKLAAIAPVVAQPADYADYGIPWDVEAEIVGRAVGRPARMGELVAASKQAVADAADANPDFDGATSMVTATYGGIYVYSEQDPRTRLMLDLGFVLPDGFAKVLGDIGESFGGNISSERADIMDVDALVCLAEQPEQQAAIETKLFEQLDVAKEGRVMWVRADDTTYTAFSFLTALSLPYLLEALVPRLVAALDGDPTTSTEEAA